MTSHPLQPLRLHPHIYPTLETTFTELVEALRHVPGALGVIVWSDDIRRKQAIRAATSDCCGILHTCDHYSTQKQFIKSIAQVIDASSCGTLYDIEDAIVARLEQLHPPLFFDHVERLTLNQFRWLETLHQRVPFALFCSNSHKTLVRTNDRKDGGHFFSRCAVTRNLDRDENDEPTPPRRKPGVLMRIGANDRQCG